MGGGEVAVGKALGEDGFGLPAVEGQAFGLLVLFVPGETQPAQAGEDGLDAGLGVALQIGVVQTQHESSVIVAGIEPIEDKGARPAHVQIAGGRGSKADPRSFCRGGVRHGEGFFPITMLAFDSLTCRHVVTVAAMQATWHPTLATKTNTWRPDPEGTPTPRWGTRAHKRGADPLRTGAEEAAAAGTAGRAAAASIRVGARG